MAKFRKGFYKGWLTDKALVELRKDITLNSLYISDYDNRFNIDPNQVCEFFCGYNEFLDAMMEDDGVIPTYPKETDDPTADWKAKCAWEDAYYKLCREYDNDTNLLAWYGCFEYDNNPFTKFVEEEKYYSY